MHEFSLAESMVDTALRTPGVDEENLTDLHVRCGALSGVNVPSLRFGFEIILEQKNLGRVNVHIRETPAFLQCECGCSYEAPTLFHSCPECSGQEHRVADGQDTVLESVEVENDESD